MGTTYTPDPVGSGFESEVNINADRAKVLAALQDSVSRSGAAPNAMAADLDLGSNKLLNVEAGTVGTDGVNLNQVSQIATTIANNIVNAGGSSQNQTTGDPITINYGTATGSQGLNNRTEFDLNTLFGVTSFLGLTVVINGVVQFPTAYTVTDDTLVTMSESLNTDDDILFIYGDLSPTPVFSNASATLNEVVATATAGQTVFTAPTYVIGQNQLLVSIDGLLQSITQGDYTETSTTSITLDEAMVGGEVVVIRNITGL